MSILYNSGVFLVVNILRIISITGLILLVECAAILQKWRRNSADKNILLVFLVILCIFMNRTNFVRDAREKKILQLV